MESLERRYLKTEINDLKDFKILITGHTGFKGSWLCEMLLQSNIEVSGISLAPPKTSLFNQLNLSSRIFRHLVCDVLDAEKLDQAIQLIKPDLIFHFAAQSIVSTGYDEPILTWNTNVIGTLNLLNSVSRQKKRSLVVVATTDKVYKNKEWEYGYRETDELGGFDPYSASKAACELAVNSWRESFSKKSLVDVVTVRAGNVIGGCDYSKNRIIPDCFNAWKQNDSVILRSPNSIRPWQHVLDALSGYINLASYCLKKPDQNNFHSFNFGPKVEGEATVQSIVSKLALMESGRKWSIDNASNENFHETKHLYLSIDRARTILGWEPSLSLQEALLLTNEAYAIAECDIRTTIQNQIHHYLNRPTSNANIP
jgi:CDP-glucose 4,6-dehydratase